MTGGVRGDEGPTWPRSSSSSLVPRTGQRRSRGGALPASAWPAPGVSGQGEAAGGCREERHFHPAPQQHWGRAEGDGGSRQQRSGEAVAGLGAASLGTPATSRRRGKDRQEVEKVVVW